MQSIVANTICTAKYISVAAQAIKVGHLSDVPSQARHMYVLERVMQSILRIVLPNVSYSRSYDYNKLKIGGYGEMASTSRSTMKQNQLELGGRP